jgi:hypothetical protein
MSAHPFRFTTARRTAAATAYAADHTHATLERLLGPCVPTPRPVPRDLAVRLAECLLEVPPARLARRSWPEGRRASIAAVLHHMGEMLGARALWLVIPGRPAQAVALDAETVLDNPFGFAALAEGAELVLLDRELPAGLWLGPPTEAGAPGWELEAWGSEPWLSAATRAVREWRASRDAG